MKIFTTVNINSLNPAARLSSLAAQNPNIMKSLIKKLQTLQSYIEERIEAREITFDEKSEKWQESPAGENFVEVTYKFQEINDQLCDWIGDFESI